MPENVKTERKIIKVAGRLREIVTIRDTGGKIVHSMMRPVMLKFYPRDAMQVIVGASILAVPVAFTEETWKLGESLPLMNIIGLLLLSIIFISSFVYYNYYRGEMRKHWNEFAKRVFTTYFFSFVVVAIILTLIERAPWSSDIMIALSRAIIVSFPASMSAAVADIIK